MSTDIDLDLARDVAMSTTISITLGELTAERRNPDEFVRPWAIHADTDYVELSDKEAQDFVIHWQEAITRLRGEA